ncbi:MAG: hypothetical protein EBZ95_14380, partial [Chitinophagia bacterium]|nr:hypothetical protein [Chitinophagia bacterium]
MRNVIFTILINYKNIYIDIIYMSTIFQKVLSNASDVEKNLLGPDYPYWKNIKNPSAIGMSDEGSLAAMSRDINGLVQYVEVLVTGGGAS